MKIRKTDIAKLARTSARCRLLNGKMVRTEKDFPL